MNLLDDHQRFKATDELALLNAISLSEVVSKKCALYAGLAENNEVKEFFAKRSELLESVVKELRKELDRVGGI